MDDLAGLTDQQLADDICTWAGRIAAGTARLLGLVAEFDRREGWAGHGLLSCAHWLSWRIGLSPGTAREWVRVARRLEELPPIRAAFETGGVSWSQVRAITRVATVEDGVDWVDLAGHSSATQLERIVRGLRRARQIEEAETDPELVAYRLRTRARYDDDGNLALTIYAPAQHAPLILAGIEAQRAELERLRATESAALTEQVVEAQIAPIAAAEPATEPQRDVPAGTPRPRTGGNESAAAGSLTQEAIARFLALVEDLAAEEVWDGGRPTEITPSHDPRVPAGTPADRSPVLPSASEIRPAAVTDAEVLVAMARTALDGQQAADPGLARRTRARLVAQVDPLSGWARLHDGELLPPTSLASVLRTLPGRGGLLRLRPLTKADLTQHDLGRNAREANQRLRELLGALDGERCRFPGCTRHRKLHAHHVVYWSDGGPTDLANLVLLCSRHHTLVHTQGFGLVLHPDRRLDVTTAEGTAVLHHPGQPWGDLTALDPTGVVSAETLPPTDCSERIDLRYVVSVLLQQAS